mgnify:CR=1 FL=1
MALSVAADLTLTDTADHSAYVDVYEQGHLNVPIHATAEPMPQSQAVYK